VFPLSPVISRRDKMTNEKDYLSVKTDSKKNIVKRSSSRRNTILMITGLLILTLALIIIPLFKTDAGTQAKELKGSWIYSGNAVYIFNGRGSGAFDLSDVKLSFSYKAENGILSIDFDDPTVQDCIYTFIIDEQTLILTGGEGTSGGTYMLTKQ